MSFLLRKVTRPWSSVKETAKPASCDKPMVPPSPDLSHLTSDEIASIYEVIRRHEEFEREESVRVRKLREELDDLQQWLAQKSGNTGKDSKQVDLRLCHFCFKTKFADGGGRICCDCHQRACHHCGVFSRPRWNSKRNKNEGRWRCKLCIARRDVQCLTGEWFHGIVDPSEELKRKLLWTSRADAESDEEYDTENYVQSNYGEGEVRKHHSLGTLNTSEPAQYMTDHQNSPTALMKNIHRQANIYNSEHKSDRGTDDGGKHKEGDKRGQKMLMLERRVSRRLQKEKRQRRRKRAEIGRPLRTDENEGNCADSSDTDISKVSTGFEGPNPASSSELQISSKAPDSDSATCISDKENKRHLSSSDVTSDGQPFEPSEVRATTKQQVKKTSGKKPIDHTSTVSDERSLQKWKKSGFSSASQVVLNSFLQEPSFQFGIKVTGGVQHQRLASRAIVSWVSSGINARISVGHEILEWNGHILRGQTYDYVMSETSCTCPRVVLIVDPVTAREDAHSLYCTAAVCSQDQSAASPTIVHEKERRRRTLPKTPVKHEVKQDGCSMRGEIQVKLLYDASRSKLYINIMRTRNIVTTTNEQFSLRNILVVALIPEMSGRSCMKTEIKESLSDAELNQEFILHGISLTELASKAVCLTLWRHENSSDLFIGEVLLDLSQAPLDNQLHWFGLEEHDENSSMLPTHKTNHSATVLPVSNMNFLSQDSTEVNPKLSPEMFSQRHLSSSTDCSNTCPALSGTSQVGSREFHLNSAYQPDSFTTKMRKKVRKTVSKMAPLSLMEKKDNSDQRNVLLAPPLPPSRTNSTSSFFLSDEEDSTDQNSVSPLTSDRPQPEGDDITSILGPGQIPPRPSAEPTVCGDIKMAFMVSKGQLRVDVICAASLLRAGNKHPPDTYVTTYLVEGKKVIQRKKTAVVKASFDPVYRQSITYSACNVHGRIMKIDVWQRANSFEKKTCLGEVLVSLDGLDLTRHTMAWYKLFQMNSTEYGSSELLDPW